MSTAIVPSESRGLGGGGIFEHRMKEQALHSCEFLVNLLRFTYERFRKHSFFLSHAFLL